MMADGSPSTSLPASHLRYNPNKPLYQQNFTKLHASQPFPLRQAASTSPAVSPPSAMDTDTPHHHHYHHQDRQIRSELPKPSFARPQQRHNKNVDVAPMSASSSYSALSSKGRDNDVDATYSFPKAEHQANKTSNRPCLGRTMSYEAEVNDNLCIDDTMKIAPMPKAMLFSDDDENNDDDELQRRLPNSPIDRRTTAIAAATAAASPRRGARTHLLNQHPSPDGGELRHSSVSVETDALSLSPLRGAPSSSAAHNHNEDCNSCTQPDYYDGEIDGVGNEDDEELDFELTPPRATSNDMLSEHPADLRQQSPTPPLSPAGNPLPHPPYQSLPAPFNGPSSMAMPFSPARPRQRPNFVRQNSALREMLKGTPSTPNSILRRGSLKPTFASPARPTRKALGLGFGSRPSALSQPASGPMGNVNPFTPARRARAGSKRSLDDDATAMGTGGDHIKSSKNSIHHRSPTKFRAPNVARYSEEFDELALIGQGAFGKVLKVRNKMDGVIYVIKKSTRRIETEAQERHLLQEVFAHAVLSHQNHIVRYFSAWEEDGFMLIQNEYCEGGSLSDEINRRRAEGNHIDEEELRLMAKHLAEGLKCLHAKNLVHLDIKPDNIFIAKEAIIEKRQDQRKKPEPKMSSRPPTLTPVMERPPNLTNRLQRNEQRPASAPPSSSVNHSSCLVPSNISEGDAYVTDQLLRTDSKSKEEERPETPCNIYKIGDLGHVCKLDSDASAVEEGDSRYLPKDVWDLGDGNVDLSKIDMYSLGISLYEAATLHVLPKNGEDWQALREGKLPTMPNRTRNFCDLVKTLMDKTPENRLTAEQVLQHPFVVTAKVPREEKTLEQLKAELEAEKMRSAMYLRRLDDERRQKRKQEEEEEQQQQQRANLAVKAVASKVSSIPCLPASNPEHVSQGTRNNLPIRPAPSQPAFTGNPFKGRAGRSNSMSWACTASHALPISFILLSCLPVLEGGQKDSRTPITVIYLPLIVMSSTLLFLQKSISASRRVAGMAAARTFSSSSLSTHIFGCIKKVNKLSFLSPRLHRGSSMRFASSIVNSSNTTYLEMYEESISDPSGFWARHARENITWRSDEFSHPVADVDLSKGHHAWFKGGKLNVTETLIDRHIASGNGDRVALIWESDEPGEGHSVTYSELHDNVCRLANALKARGVGPGDPVCLYMPMTTMAVYSMLACARLGAPHSIVFAGFSADALRSRIQNIGSRFVLTADEGKLFMNNFYITKCGRCLYFIVKLKTSSSHIGVRGGKVIPLKAIVDEALVGCEDLVESVFVSARTGSKDVKMVEGRDIFMEQAMKAEVAVCEPEIMDAEDPLFYLYTSGSTGAPKGLQHSTAGYLVYAQMTHKHVFDYKDGDVFACVADVGWITGHTYVVYGPLANGATTVLFESIPTYPDAGRYWDMVERHGINQLYTAPTAIRLLIKNGDHYVTKYDRSSLRTLGTVGEPINPEAWKWYHEIVGESRCAVVDTWWQTETGGHMLTPLATDTDQKPGAAMRPFFGVEPALLDGITGEELQGNNQSGLLVMKV
eukprot:UC4_evm2s577